MTLNQIASIADSDIRTGLKGVSNYSYTLPMLERELIVLRNRIIATNSRKPGFRSEGFTQSINCINVDREQLSKCPANVSSIDDPIMHIELPMMDVNLLDTVIDYLGPATRSERSWKIYYNEDFKLHKHKPATACLPYVYLDPTSNGKGMLDGFIFNFRGNVKYLSYTGIPQNPEDAELFQCHGPLENFPAPDWAVEEMLRRVTTKYVQYYRQLHAPTQVNDQTDKVS
jgi:hypothetical protein